MAMQWEEISRRLRNGTSVQILAELDNVPYKTMLGRIKYHERKEGKKYIKPDQLKKERKWQPKEPKGEPAPEPVPIIELSCENCNHKSHRDNKPFCTMGIDYRGKGGICGLWAPYDEDADIPEDVYKPAQKKSLEDLPGYEIQPETIDELNHLYFTCKRLAEKYQKQAEDWAKIMQICAKLGNQRRDAEMSGGGADE